MSMDEKVKELIEKHTDIQENLSRSDLIKQSVKRKEALISENGALVTWTPTESTGRSPKDTYLVKNPESAGNIDWSSPNNIPMEPETFQMIFEDAIEKLSEKDKLFILDRVVGADAKYALPVKTITYRALSQVFIDNMFRAVPPEIEESVFYDKAFTLLVLPYDKLDVSKYEGRLRKLDDGKTSDMAVVMDVDNKIGIVFGSAYCGSMKKMIFTAMNYYLPDEGVLPLHCSANEGEEGDVALLLGLSGTGKTTLSADPTRALYGDDEHAWSNDGVFNFENGCYAKLIDLTREKEPEIYDAIMQKKNYLEHGAIVENAMMYPDGNIDFFDARYTPNSRGSYPLNFLSNIKESSKGGHPKHIIFLTADANGIIPPIAKLNKEQAMLWFLMGYTSKLAGTETGIVDPISTFSRFFGEPFMPRNPDTYAKLLGEKLDEYDAQVWLVNTGWINGAYGSGKRIPIQYNWNCLHAMMRGDLDNVEYRYDEVFHLSVPLKVANVPAEILEPKNGWDDKEEYEKRVEKLAGDFKSHFEKAYKGKVSSEIEAECPGY